MTLQTSYVQCLGMSAFIGVTALIMLWMASGRVGRARELDESGRWIMGIIGGGIMALLICFWLYAWWSWPYR